MWPFSKREQATSPQGEERALQAWPWDTGGAPPIRSVGVERALSLVPVYGAARLLADSVASLPLCLFSQGVDGIPASQGTPSLFRQPSVHGTLFDWLHRCVTSLALQGNAYGLITARDYYGFPTMIEWLNPDDVTVNDGQVAGEGSFMRPVWYWQGRRINTEDLLHIPWFSLPYRIKGLSPIGAFASTANTGLGAEEYAASWFQNGGVPPGTFRNSEQKVSKDDADLITARLTSRLQTRKPLVFGKDWEYNPIAIKPNEAQFVETMRLTATQIAVIYGIPPEKIGGSTGSSLTYSTQEQNSIDYLTFSLRPWLVRLEAALNQVFPRGQYVKFDTTEILRTDAKTRAEIDALALANQAWSTVDEVRRSRDQGPMPKPAPVPAPVPQPVADPAPPKDQPVQRQLYIQGRRRTRRPDAA